MKFELVVKVQPSGVTIAILRDGHLIELHEEKGSGDFNVGDIYFGKIKKVVPSLNAAFVNVGYEKDAFLHYLDLGPQFQSLNKFTKNTLNKKQSVPNLVYFKGEKDIDKNGKINDVLSSNQPIVVQIAKEPISSKGPRLTSEITLAGRFLVLVPFSDKISVSQKIRENSEKDRLKRLLESIKPKNFGVIIRTVAQNKKVAELDQDLKDLVAKWEEMHKNLTNAKPPKRILGELNKATSILRDLLDEKFSNVFVDDEALVEELTDFIKSIAPGRESIVKHHKSTRKDIFEQYGVNKQIKMLFGKKVPLPSGGYLIIEHTEAMHVIDVNSGNRSSDNNQSDNALSTNMEAAGEIARVLRLRDMGGIVAIDFIDMHGKDHNKVLYEKLKDVMKDDRAKHNIIPPSRFGVVEITRQRVRPETEIKTSEVCPTCNGTGEVQASILFADEIENQLKFLLEERKEKNVTLEVHPYLESFFKRGMVSKQMKWFMKYKKWIPVRGMTSKHLLDYSFLDKNEEEITI